jgi:hypothetical protein
MFVLMIADSLGSSLVLNLVEHRSSADISEAALKAPLRQGGACQLLDRFAVLVLQEPT